ncbi:MAG: ABC transporter substrate-binding protein, partial [Gammaproteobacteria bacterium]
MTGPHIFSRSRRNFVKVAAVTGAGLAAGVPNLAWGESKKLNVYNWDTYIGETTIETYSKATGVEVQYDLYANLEEMYAKFQEGNPGYDVIFPSDYMLETMVKAEMLVELDRSRLPNFKHVDPNFLDPKFDPGCKHNIPFFWGSVGIGYRKSKVEAPDSWGVLFDSAKHSGRIALLADSRFVIALALMYLGHSANSTSADEIGQAR